MANIMLKVIDNSKLVLDELNAKIPVALEAVGLQAEGNAQLALGDHVDTGLLHNSITHALAGESPAISAYSADKLKNGKIETGTYSGTVPGDKGYNHTVYIGTNVEYAIYLETGTSKMDPVGYLKRAASKHIAEYKKILETFLK